MDHIQLETEIKARKFLDELTELAIKHGMGIAGSPVLFVMEPEDKLLTYTMDAESRVTFT